MTQVGFCNPTDVGYGMGTALRDRLKGSDASLLWYCEKVSYMMLGIMIGSPKVKDLNINLQVYVSNTYPEVDLNATILVVDLLWHATRNDREESYNYSRHPSIAWCADIRDQRAELING